MTGQAPPSRQSNPFATCWTRPGALPHVDCPGASVAAVVERIERHASGVCLVGPHGSGKSTLLAALQEPLAERGWRPRRVPADWPADAGDAGRVLLVEGLERLPFLQRRRRLRRWRRAGARPVVTLHHGATAGLLGLPIVARTSPDAELLLALFERLTAARATPVGPEDALHSYARHGQDLRSVWFDLYDLHERRTRQRRTASASAA